MIYLQFGDNMGSCAYLDKVNEEVLPKTKGCEECEKAGEMWVSLHICLTCGHVGCSDSSPGRHATRHFQKTDHPVMAAFPERKWRWCYIDNEYV